MKKASLSQLRKMKEKGELFHDAHAPEGQAVEVEALETEMLDAAFWAKAKIIEPQQPRSVHLKIEPEVFEFFHTLTNGKGHISRMQAVLKAYMLAHNR